MRAVNTPPAESASRTHRQPSTPGMDTLADLASMQHHQQTARVNAGGLRSAEIYDSPTSSSAVIPSVIRPQTSTQLREPSLLRGSSSESSVNNIPPEAHSPRTFSRTALSSEELERVAQLTTFLTTNPFHYDSHVQLINILHQGFSNQARGEASQYPLRHDLQSARETMHAKFALGDDLWVDWIQDQILLARSFEDRITVMELCEKAVEGEPNSTKLWEVYGQYMLQLYQSANSDDARVAEIGTLPKEDVWTEEDKIMAREVISWQQVIAVWDRGSQETAHRLNDSHVMWDTYNLLLLQDLASSPSQEGFAQAQYHFTNRLQTPHMTWDKTLESYSSFVTTYDNSNYENTMVTAKRLGANAKSKADAREIMEIKILRATQSNDKELELQVYNEYLDWELSQSRMKGVFDFGLLSGLYQRATLRFPANMELWEAYAMFVIEEISQVRRDVSVFPILDRATRHCPGSGTLWSHYMLAAENHSLSFIEVEDIKHRATSSGLLDAGGMEEVLKVHTAWCGFLRRRAFHQNSIDEDMDVAEVGIRSAIENMENLGREKYGEDYQGDPLYRLEKIYIKYLSQSCNWDSARDQYKKLIPRKGDKWDFWLRYYLWEMGTWGKLAFGQTGYDGKRHAKPTEATKVLVRAMNRPKLDWPEKIIETFQYHCEDNEGAEELQSSIAQIWKAKRNVQRRREREQYEAYEAAQAQALRQQQQQDNQEMMVVQGEGEGRGKRKREDDVKGGSSKKVRPLASQEVEPQVEEQQPSASSLLKRDRENSTVVVKNLPVETTDVRLRQYFRDVSISQSNLQRRY